MNGKVLMSAIGNINDKYIMEFAKVLPIRKQRSALFTRIIPVAACLCIIVMSVVLLMQRNDINHIKPVNISDGNVIWGDGAGDNILDDYSEKASKGTIIIAETLETAMNNSKNENDMFAVLVTEMSDISKDDVYNIFIKPLEIDEEYMENGIIFASENQIRTLKCPDNFALVLSLAVKPYEDKPVNQEIPDTALNQKIKVKIFLKFNSYDILAQYSEQLYGLSDEVYQKMKQSIIKAEISKIINKFIDDYEISDDLLCGVGIYIPEFTAKLDITLISKIINDERVELVLEETDSIGLDQG